MKPEKKLGSSKKSTKISKKKGNNNLIIIAVAAVVLIGAYALMTGDSQKTDTKKTPG